MDIIGNYVPIAGYVLSSVALSSSQSFLFPFFLFGFLNDLLNRILKRLIRDPRPTLFQHQASGKFDTLTFIAGKWGMPSGHAQHIFYCIGYLSQSGYISINRVNIIPLLALLSIATLYQRWVYHYHTIPQLVVGSIVGFLFGIFSVYFVTKNEFMRI